MLAIRNNLQLAISEVLSSNPCSAPAATSSAEITPEVPLSKLICAYIRIAGFNEAKHALPSFERALEKIPECHSSKQPCTTQEGIYWAGLVSRIRKEYWTEVLDKDTYGTKRSFYSCPCCGKQVRAEQMKKSLGLDDDDKQVNCEKDLKKCDPDVKECPESAKKRTRKVKRRSVHSRKVAKKVAFDPYGPSTSKVSM